MHIRNNIDEVIGKVVEFSKITFGDDFHSVVLYGSYARGDYDDESDVDIMIMVNKNREELAGFRSLVNNYCADLDLQYNVVLSSKLQSRAFFDEWKTEMPFYKNVERDGIVYV